MALTDDFCGILNLGVRKERDAHDFYLRAADRTDHPLGKQMFERLAEEETKHEQLLQAWAAGGACPTDVAVPESDPDIIRRAHAKIDEVVAGDTTDLDAIEFGQEMERKAIAFYADAAAKAADDESRALLERLKGEEDKHLALLTDLYEYMRDPKVWSIRDEKRHFDS